MSEPMEQEQPDEVWFEAKEELRKAIVAFYAKVEPSVFIDDWVLITHKESIELSKDGQSMIGINIPTGQAFHRTSGLILEASKAV